MLHKYISYSFKMLAYGQFEAGLLDLLQSNVSFYVGCLLFKIFLLN